MNMTLKKLIFGRAIFETLIVSPRFIDLIQRRLS